MRDDKRRGPAATGPQRFPDTPNQDYGQHPDPSTLGLQPEDFPSWNPAELRNIVLDVVVMASPDQVIPGVLDSAACWIPGEGVLQFHFDGAGGVVLDERSDCTQALVEVANALVLVLGDRFRVGEAA